MKARARSTGGDARACRLAVRKNKVEKGKRPQSAFSVFMDNFRKDYKEKHRKLKQFPIIGKSRWLLYESRIGKSALLKWKNMSDASKAPFVAKAKKLKAQRTRIIGSLVTEGAALLGLPSKAYASHASVHHCFTVAELSHILSGPSPCIVNVSGLESLSNAHLVREKLRNKFQTCTEWACCTYDTIWDLECINNHLDKLRQDLLPAVAERPTKHTAALKVLKKARTIRKNAVALKKKIQGGIASEMCRLIESDAPRYLKEHVPELIAMALAEQAKPVWFLPYKGQQAVP